jgi:hypothetical protein
MEITMTTKPIMRRNERGESALGFLLGLLAIALIDTLVLLLAVTHDQRHSAKVMLTKKHHVAMRDDKGKWYEYVLDGTDVFPDIGRNARGEFQLPRGGSWQPSKPLSEEEDEAVAEEETTIDETPNGEPDGAGDVGGDDGGDAGGDSGGDGD